MSVFNLPTEPWRELARCRDLEPAEADRIFYPDSVRGKWHQWEEAQEFCGGCPVQFECVDHAVEADERDGYWGKSPQERADIRDGVKRRERGRPRNPNPQPEPLKPCGTPAAYRRHRYKGEDACEACLEAHRVYQTPNPTRPVGRAS